MNNVDVSKVIEDFKAEFSKTSDGKRLSDKLNELASEHDDLANQIDKLKKARKHNNYEKTKADNEFSQLEGSYVLSKLEGYLKEQSESDSSENSDDMMDSDETKLAKQTDDTADSSKDELADSDADAIVGEDGKLVELDSQNQNISEDELAKKKHDEEFF